MPKNQTLAERLVYILSLVLIIGGLIISFMLITNTNADPLLKICGVLAILSVLSAGYYIVMGHSKNAAIYFRVFNGFFVISQLGAIVAIGTVLDSPIDLLLSAILFGVALSLFLSQNLGRKLSFLLCGFLVFLALVKLVIAIFAIPVLNAGGSSLGTLILLHGISQLLLSGLLFALTYAKYLDKVARNRTV